MNLRRVLALLGKRDEPTDGLRDYCRYLGEALARRSIRLEAAEVPWQDRGWFRALAHLRRESKNWKGDWALVQYTALGWSRRGFPFGFLAVLWVLRCCGAKCAIVFHDANPFPGGRRVDRVRRAYQRRIMRRAYSLAERCIFPIPIEKVAWLPANRSKAVFIPIGANLPECGCVRATTPEPPRSNTARTIAIFSVTGGHVDFELSQIRHAVCRASEKVPQLELVVFGRGSLETRDVFVKAFEGTPVKLSILGLLPAEQLVRQLADADVLLFVRGSLSGRRGSALAGIACGLPIVGFAGPETGFPLTGAGVELVPAWDRDALADALTRVLSDDALRSELRERSRRAQANYFSWDRIAEQLATVLGNA
ncbi:MAG: glycosyltransferase [Candidatus Acidiferrales bacterium]